MKQCVYVNNYKHGKLYAASATINPLMQELNPSAQRYLPSYFYWGFLIFKGLTAQLLYKSFGVKGLRKIRHVPY
jgi:hypothetical protein